jgi:tetratricopeptide (TPR) repeat protein
MRSGFAAIVVLFVLLSISTLALSASDKITTSSDRPFQALFSIEFQAAQAGWTADLALQAGHVWKVLGNLPRATSYWEVAVQQDSDNVEVWRNLAEAYIALQRWSLATIALARLIELNPDDNWSHYQLGLMQIAVDPERARAELKLAARDSANQEVSDDLLLALKLPASLSTMHVGVTLSRHNLWNYAELTFQHIVALDEPLPEALAYLGLARDQQEKNGSQQIEQAVKIAPDHALIRYIQGLHLRLRGDNVGSLDAFLRAATYEPPNPAYAAELGTAYQLIGDLPLAEEWLRKAVTLSDNDPRFQQLLDQFLSQLPPADN